MSHRDFTNMKLITSSLLLVFTLGLFAVAQDNQTTDKPSADNPARNTRNASGDAKTSGDQSNTSDDLRITSAIRHDILADDSLAMTAANVEIITANGIVSLRGLVKTTAEKEKIAKIARNEAGPLKVDDQLRVEERN